MVTLRFTMIVLLLPVVTIQSGVIFRSPKLIDSPSIQDIQFTTDPSGDSPYAGQEVTVSGIVTSLFFDGFTIAEASGGWHAIYIYTKSYAPQIGDEIEVTGTVEEYYGFTEINNITDVQTLSTGNTTTPFLLNANSITQEQYEAVLIQLTNVTVSSLEDYGEWIIADSSGSIRCDDLNDYLYFPSLGDTFESITGIVFYSFGDYKVEPRFTADLTGDPIPHYALGGDIVTMNETRQIFPSAFIEIYGDLIIDIHATPPPGIPSISTNGYIFPGLIDAHNHPHYNILDWIPFEQEFEERYSWQEHSIYELFKDQFNDIVDFGGVDVQRTNLIKFAEVRALMAGTTTIQGFNANGHAYDSFAHQGIGINNAERFPSRVYSEVFPLRQGISFWEQKDSEYWDRFLIHLSEGTNQASLDEVYEWANLGMLDHRTSIIHGVPYGQPEWSLISAAEASLIWSPQSNIRLYGVTADIPGAIAAGVNVALAPDWTESGSLNILDELKFARFINQSRWNNSISSQQFVEMVTVNPSKALGINRWAGQINAGFRADLMVIPKDETNPYNALLNAQPKDVALTIVSGRPMYGDPNLMDAFPFITSREEVVIAGVIKQLSIQVDSHVIPESEKTVTEIYSQLETAYQASDPQICDFLGLERVLTPGIFLPLIMHGN